MQTLMIYILDIVAVMTIFMIVTVVILAFRFALSAGSNELMIDIDSFRRDVRDKDNVITDDSVFHNFLAR